MARAALEVLRSARHRREVYTGTWLPEPIVSYGAGTVVGSGVDQEPAEQISLDDVNGELAIGVFDGAQLSTAVSVTLDDDRVSRIDLVRSPLKLPSGAAT